MHGANLENFRIPANQIQELEVPLGNGGQASVFQGVWKRWGAKNLDVAIKKWGGKNPATTVDHPAMKKYKNEVKMLSRLHHRSVNEQVLLLNLI